jgi:hypothetical protein
MNLRSKLLAATVLGSSLYLGGCAKTMDQIDAQGGFFTSEKAPYVVIKQSGGIITDVYKLPNAIVQSEQGSDGWLYLDQNNRPVHIGGDMKSIRFKSVPQGVKTTWNCYFEYHREFETKSYEELHGVEAQKCMQSLKEE